MQILPLEPTEAITFDMYGTLLDSVVGFAPEFEGFLKTKGYPGSAPEVVQAWEMAYLHECSVDTVLGRPRTPFEVVRRLTLSQLLYKLKIGHTKNDIEELVTAKATPTLFPHVKELRTRVQGKFQMTALFNGDLKSPDRTINGLDILLARWTSDERAGFYKPHTGLYQHALGCQASRCSASRPVLGTSAEPGLQAGGHLHRLL